MAPQVKEGEIAAQLAVVADGASVASLPRAPTAERQYRWASKADQKGVSGATKRSALLKTGFSSSKGTLS